VVKGLAPVTAAPGCLIAFSAEPGSAVSFEYTHETNAVFTSSILERIHTPDLSLPDLMAEAQLSVLGATDNRQAIWYDHKMMSDFFFPQIAHSYITHQRATCTSYISYSPKVSTSCAIKLTTKGFLTSKCTTPATIQQKVVV